MYTPAMESRSRWIAVGLALVAASAFALAVQTAWWSVAEVTIGPFGSRHCFGGQCRETGLAWLGAADLWMRSGVATRAGGYIAMFALIVLAGTVAAKRVPALIARASLVAIITATVAAVYFIAAFRGVPGLAEISLGAGVFLFAGGVLAGVAAAVLVLRSSARGRS